MDDAGASQPPPPKKRRHPQLARASGLLARMTTSSASSSSCSSSPPPPPVPGHEVRPSSSPAPLFPRPPAPFAAREMQRQLEGFVHDGLVESAEMLALLLVSTADQDPASLLANVAGDERQEGEERGEVEDAEVAADRFHARSFELFGDLLVLKREFRRAIHYYARSHRRLARASALSAPPSSPKAGLLPHSQSAFAVPPGLALKMAQCHVHLGHPQPAIDTLAPLREEERTLPVLLLLGRLYLREGLKREAEANYSRALRLNPYALEAAVALAELAASHETAAAAGSNNEPVSSTENVLVGGIEGFYSPEKAPDAGPAKADGRWMKQLVTAHINTARGRHKAALDAFSALDATFPGNLHSLAQRARLELDLEHLPSALLLFTRARQRDPLSLAHMDALADCLRRRALRSAGRSSSAGSSNHQQLNALVRELFDVSDAHAEPWLAAAFHAALKGELETALQFCERSLSISSTASGILTGRTSSSGPTRAHLLRGELLLQLRRPERALSAFLTACRLQAAVVSGSSSTAMDAYTGVVLSYCELCALGAWERFREAVGAARRVVQLFPENAQSYTLLGRVYALRSEHRENARRALRKALELDPRNLLANFAHADLLVAEGSVRAAIDRLAPLAELQPEREDVLSKLAHAYVLDRQYAEAMATLHRAHALFPASVEIARGLERVEKLLRGEDPDEALSTTMEQLEGGTDGGDDDGEYLGP